jgi:hypothetical protein
MNMEELIRMKLKTLFLAATFGLSTLSASTLGTFDLSGDITVNGTTSIVWTNTNGVADQATISDATGIFASLDNDVVTIDNLTSASEPTGSSFSDAAFVVLPSGFQPLLIDMIFAGVDGTAGCAAAPPAPGQMCTPPLPSGVSPFNLENLPPPTAVQSSAAFSISGDYGVAGASGSWFGSFTSQFNVPFQTVLAMLGSGTTGTVSDSYSATFTVNSPSVTSSTPETSTLSMFALGLGLIVIGRSTRLIGRARR